MDTLHTYFRGRFRGDPTKETMCIKYAAQQVHHHYNNIRNIIHDDVMITPQLLMSQKPNSDPSVAKNYRPVVISSTLAKLIEVHILRECNHEFHALQFGFIESRGTTMAASLTHDVISYFVSHGSPHACSLDAEGAFDALPHPVIFYKAIDVIPDIYWRILVHWYQNLTVCIQWGNYISEDTRVRMGTRQGGLSSPFLFNLFYEGMIHGISNMTCGMRIQDKTFNVYCYADDLLVTSATVVGLQEILNYANQYVKSHGLRFNPMKTECITFGKNPFKDRKWCLENSELKQVSRITYLGVVLSVRPNIHSDERIKAVKRAFYALQGAGLCVGGVNPDVIAQIYNAIVRPVLTYGLHCVSLSKGARESVDKIQAKLLKATLGLKPSCRSSPLLHALKIPLISKTVDLQQMKLLRSMFLSSSRTSYFYNMLIDKHYRTPQPDGKDLVARVQDICQCRDISFVRYVL